MGGYGTYLGFRIRYSDDVVRYLTKFQPFLILISHYRNCCHIITFILKYLVLIFLNTQEEKVNAKDLHPKLLGGMFFFFALGATGGITSLLTSDKPIFER